MTEKDFLSQPYTQTLEKGQVSWQSPSNIALIKYWGKHGEQLPKNPSVSFTLTDCQTTTTLFYERKDSAGFDFQVYLEGRREEGFEPKIRKFFERIKKYVPFIEDYTFRIETANSFPHSSGIASSASGMSALSLCLMKMETRMAEGEYDDAYFRKKASFLARLGSGSACRSIEGPLIVWGRHDKIENSSDLYGTRFPYDIHQNFLNYRDTILLIDEGEKQVSSTVGHNLMHDNPFASQRFRQAENNLEKLIPVLTSGNLDEFIKIVESEALSLHAMMMTSQPYFILMKPNTLEVINRIWKYRYDTGSKLCFTLDAGANVHVLYPETEAVTASLFIKNELSGFCKNGRYIEDKVGIGARQLL